MKNPKWIILIEAVNEDYLGYWEQRRWSEQAWVQTTSVIDAANPSGGEVRVGGIAFAGARGISRVEIQADGGDWLPVQLNRPLSPLTWVLWSTSLQLGPGQHQISVLAVDGDGAIQTAEVSPTHPDGATGYHKTTIDVNHEINPQEHDCQSVYKIMIGSIVPRPIGWVSTIDSDGQPNLAPFSFFNAVCGNPPHLVFCPMIRATDKAHKDTLRNLRATGEFVVNIVTEELVEAMNLTSTELLAGIDEFKLAGLLAERSAIVRPPRVTASPIHYECVVAHILEFGDQPGGGAAVIGKIVHLHVSEAVLIGEDKIDLASLKPVGRLAGSAYCRVTDIFEMARPASQIRMP
jgi:flavin reductase (DIM6/NTAB) family NADH-FMN oxidoreductase RutF